MVNMNQPWDMLTWARPDRAVAPGLTDSCLDREQGPSYHCLLALTSSKNRKLSVVQPIKGGRGAPVVWANTTSCFDLYSLESIVRDILSIVLEARWCCISERQFGSWVCFSTLAGLFSTCWMNEWEGSQTVVEQVMYMVYHWVGAPHSVKSAGPFTLSKSWLFLNRLSY